MAESNEMEVGNGLLKAMSGLAGADGVMLELERRVPSAFAGRGGCWLSGCAV